MISVIIPALNEAHTIEFSLRSLLSCQENIEVIVADGGSSDRTTDIVRKFSKVKQVNSAKGRGRQMNEGAMAARGDTLLFLHADTHLPPYAFATIQEVMKDPRVAGGCFWLSFDCRNFALRIYSMLSRINHILFTYGDQGLFLRRDAFGEMGGFKDIPIMEDVEIQKRLRRVGRFVKIRYPVVTSARRFVKYGSIKQEALNVALVFLYHLGASSSFLKRFYM